MTIQAYDNLDTNSESKKHPEILMTTVVMMTMINIGLMKKIKKNQQQKIIILDLKKRYNYEYLYF
jgi:hypothetical protein